MFLKKQLENEMKYEEYGQEELYEEQKEGNSIERQREEELIIKTRYSNNTQSISPPSFKKVSSKRTASGEKEIEMKSIIFN